MVLGLILMGVGAATPFLANWLIPPKCAACPPGYIQHDEVACGEVGRCEMGPALKQAILAPVEQEAKELEASQATVVPFFENPWLIGGVAVIAVGTGVYLWGGRR